MSRPDEFKGWPVAPKGSARVEVPDGVTFAGDGPATYSNLYDTDSPPMQQSGDMQTRIVRYPRVREKPPITE